MSKIGLVSDTDDEFLLQEYAWKKHKRKNYDETFRTTGGINAKIRQRVINTLVIQPPATDKELLVKERLLEMINLPGGFINRHLLG